MSVSSHYESVDLALFAMQLLQSEGHETVAAHVAGCPFCLEELAYLQGDLAMFAHTVEVHPSPAAVRERVLRRVAREKKVLPVEPVEPARPMIEPTPGGEPSEEPLLTFTTRGRHHAAAQSKHQLETSDPQRPAPGSSLRKLFLWLGWITAAGFAVAAVRLHQERDRYSAGISLQAAEIERLKEDAAGSKQVLETITNPEARHIQLSAVSTESLQTAPQGRAIYVPSKGALIFLANGLDRLQPDKTYELWLIPADGRDPIPAGTFYPDAQGNASVILPSLPRAIEAKAFGVTIEDGKGSQSPTLPIILAGS